MTIHMSQAKLVAFGRTGTSLTVLCLLVSMAVLIQGHLYFPGSCWPAPALAAFGLLAAHFCSREHEAPELHGAISRVKCLQQALLAPHVGLTCAMQTSSSPIPYTAHCLSVPFVG